MPEASPPIPTEAPVAYGPLFAIERERLLGLLSSLDGADWSRPTPCPSWSVLDLAVHLVGDDLSLVSWQRDDHHGTVPPAGLDGDGFIAWIDELQLEWVHAARRLSPRLTMELLRWLDDEIVALISAQDPVAVTSSVSWAGEGPVPVWLDQARELSERWIHRQQLLDALDRPSDLRPDLAAPVLDGLRWAIPYRLGANARPAGATVTVTVEDEPLAVRWCCVSGGDGWRFAPEPGGEVVASLRLSSDQAWRLLTNNYRVADHGPLRPDGDPDLVETLLATRAIIGRAQ